MAKKAKQKMTKKEKRATLVQLLLGVAIGVFFLPWVFAMDSFETYWLALLLFLVANIFIVPVHEAGHLVFGLLTGYRLQSFAAFRWQIFRTKEKKWKVSAWAVPGALGQCVMEPPQWPQDGRLPYWWYNAGGILITAVLGLVSLLVALPKYGTLAGLMWWAVFCALFLSVLTNLLPMMALINNDGMNLRLLRKREQSRLALWKQLRINADYTMGQHLQDMPDAWFVNEEDAQNTLEGEIDFLRLYRLLAMQDYEQAKQESHALLEKKEALLALRQKMVVAIGALCELLTDEKGTCLREYVTPEYQQSVKGMAGVLLMPVVSCGVHLLHEDDAQKAEKSRLAAEKIIRKCKTKAHTNEAEVLLMQNAYEKWQMRHAQDEANVVGKETNE